MEERNGQLPPSPPVLELSSSSPESAAAKKQVDRRVVVLASLISIVVLVLLIVVVALLLVDPARTANIRDIVIILFAFGSLMMGVVLSVLLSILIYRIQDLISFMRGELVPMVTNVQNTVNTVSGTTTFVSDNVAKPVIKAAGFVSGMRQMARSANAKVKSRTGR